MDTKRFRLDTALTLIAAYLGLFVGLIDANSINLALPAIRDTLGGAVHDRSCPRAGSSGCRAVGHSR